MLGSGDRKALLGGFKKALEEINWLLQIWKVFEQVLLYRDGEKQGSSWGVSVQPFCFSLSVQYSINSMRYSTLPYKIVSLLDDFAQLEAEVSVLSTFKVGEAKL